MTETIPYHELIAWGERQKKGELHISGMEVIDHGYRLDYTGSNPVMPTILGNDEPDFALPVALPPRTSRLETDGSEPMKVGSQAGQTNPGSGELVNAGVSRDPVKTEKPILNESDGEATAKQPAKEESHDQLPGPVSENRIQTTAICPACNTSHPPEADCDQDGLTSRFMAIAELARKERQKYAIRKRLEREAEEENPDPFL